MRILIYNWRDMAHPRAGGAEVYTKNVARHWVAGGHAVTWFCSQPGGLPSVEIEDGIKIVRRGGRVTVYQAARHFYEQEGRGHFDVVVDEVNTRPFLCPSFVNDVPVVALIHQVCREVWFYESPLPIALIGRYWLEPRWLKQYCDVPVVTVSESSRLSLLEYGLRNVAVIPQGLTGNDAVLCEKAVDPTIIFVGRLTKNKRPQHVIQAFQMASKELPRLQLWMVGSGPLERRLRRIAGGRVRFYGKVGEQEKFELLSRAHALLATSVREGWGMTVSEAASVGTPAIAYEVAGLCDSVTASGGMLVEPTPDALAAAIVQKVPHLCGAGPVSLPSSTKSWAYVAESLFDELQRASQRHGPSARATGI